MAEPPADVKETIKKTVVYVKKNGISFEEKLLQNDPDGKFSFLKSSDAYHHIYKSLLEGEAEETTGAVSQNVEKSKKPIQPLPLLFVTETPPISTYDLQVIKLTAQYAACNSAKQVESLQRHMDKKGNRSQFAFLNKNHSFHPIYQNYCKQYLAIIDFANGSKSTKSAEYIEELIKLTPQEMFQKAYERAAYEKKNKIDRKAEESETRKAQLQYALIDWQDFALVAKISFDAIDEVSELAVPLRREDVVYRSLLAKSKELKLEVSTVKEDKINATKQEEKITENIEKGTPVEPVTAAETASPSPVPKGMKIRAAGESRLKRKGAKPAQDGERTIQCPITGQAIPELKFDNHLKVLLRDPRYKEQQDNFVKKNFTYASNLTTDQVYENIKRLVKKRGLSEEEEQHTKRLDIGPQV